MIFIGIGFSFGKLTDGKEWMALSRNCSKCEGPIREADHDDPCRFYSPIITFFEKITPPDWREGRVRTPE